MTPAALERLQAASDFVLAELGKGTAAVDIIAALQRDHNATLALRPAGNVLRVAGVSGTCTWSRDKGLLDSWRKNATVRIVRERAA